MATGNCFINSLKPSSNFLASLRGLAGKTPMMLLFPQMRVHGASLKSMDTRRRIPLFSVLTHTVSLFYFSIIFLSPIEVSY